MPVEVPWRLNGSLLLSYTILLGHWLMDPKVVNAPCLVLVTNDITSKSIPDIYWVLLSYKCLLWISPVSLPKFYWPNKCFRLIAPALKNLNFSGIYRKLISYYVRGLQYMPPRLLGFFPQACWDLYTVSIEKNRKLTQSAERSWEK